MHKQTNFWYRMNYNYCPELIDRKLAAKKVNIGNRNAEKSNPLPRAVNICEIAKNYVTIRLFDTLQTSGIDFLLFSKQWVAGKSRLMTINGSAWIPTWHGWELIVIPWINSAAGTSQRTRTMNLSEKNEWKENFYWHAREIIYRRVTPLSVYAKRSTCHPIRRQVADRKNNHYIDDQQWIKLGHTQRIRNGQAATVYGMRWIFVR